MAPACSIIACTDATLWAERLSMTTTAPDGVTTPVKARSHKGGSELRMVKKERPRIVNKTVLTKMLPQSYQTCFQHQLKAT